jgi:hypothetical protein
MLNANPEILDALTQKGVLINVSVRYWRARKKLAPEDLGLTADVVNERLFSLGHKRLLPRESLQRLALIEGRTHALVEAGTFSFLGGLARFLPNPKLDEVVDKLRQKQSEFFACRDSFLDQYDELREQALVEWRNAADRLDVDPERLASVIEDSFPPKSKVESSFAFDIQLFQIAMPKALPTRQLLDLATQQEIIQARKEAAVSARHEIEASCRAFIADCTATLRQQTAKLAEEMLATIQATGNVHQKTLNRLVKFIDTFGQLNFMDDEDMAKQLDAVKAQLLKRPAAEYRDSRFARDQLVNGLRRLRETAADLAQQDVSGIVDNFGQLGKRRFQLAA